MVDFVLVYFPLLENPKSAFISFFVCFFLSPKQFVFSTSKGNSCPNKSPLKSTSHFGHKRTCQSFHFVIYFACPRRSRKYYFPFSAFYIFLKTAFCLLLCTWTLVVFFCRNLLWNFSIWSSQLLICYVAHVWSRQKLKSTGYRMWKATAWLQIQMLLFNC